MKYLEFLWALDTLSKCYPGYYSNHLLSLADDVLRWLNNELPTDSSALHYLKSIFDSPNQAIEHLADEIALLSGPFQHPN